MNIEALREAVTYVKAQALLPENERTWDQTTYRALRQDWTDDDAEPVQVGCLASHICDVAGGRWWSDWLYDLYAEPDDNRYDLFGHETDYRLPRGSWFIAAPDRARRILDVSTDWACQLFLGYLSADDIGSIAEECADAYGETL